MNTPKVSIVVLNWNGRDDTLECLESLRAIDYATRNVIVVDNGSADDSVAAITSRFPEVKVIETGENLGYAGGNNVGIRYALDGDPEFLLLLNNDTKVDRKLVSHLVSAASDNPSAAFLSPKIYFYSEPERIWFAGGKWVEEKSRFIYMGYGMEDASDRFNAVMEIDWACGCALFVRVSAMRKIGLLDERFFLVFEDVDWCYRAREAGYMSILVPQAVLWHKASRSFGGSTSPLISYFHTRNRLLWGRKHLSMAGFATLCCAIYSELIPRRPPLKVDAAVGGAYAKALYWAILQYRDEIRKWVADLRKELATAHVRGCLYGVRDFFIGRFGNPAATTLRRFS